jgi:hypothetical protein
VSVRKNSQFPYIGDGHPQVALVFNGLDEIGQRRVGFFEALEWLAVNGALNFGNRASILPSRVAASSTFSFFNSSSA